MLPESTVLCDYHIAYNVFPETVDSVKVEAAKNANATWEEAQSGNLFLILQQCVKT